MPQRITRIASLALAIILSAVVAAPSEPPRPPVQPDSGPGGKQYVHQSVTKNRYGEGAKEYWLFEPASPRPQSAPVIVFLHGWGGVNPMYYGAWLDHLVRRGNIVIYPRYQNSLLTPVKEFTPNMMHAIKDAMQRLQKDRGRVRPDLNKFATAGHSMGGLLAVNLAALSPEYGLPRVKAVMSIQPGITAAPVNFPLADLKKLTPGTLLLTVAGDQDGLTGDRDARRIFLEATRISRVNKDFVTLVTDNHGLPALKGSHRAPTAPHADYDSKEDIRGSLGALGGLLSQRGNRRERELPAVDALDFYGTWKLFDGLCDAAFYGRNREYALGNTPQQRFMGKWSDGTPVRELRVIED